MHATGAHGDGGRPSGPRSGADRPEVTAEADVTLVSRGVVVTARVEVSSDEVLLLRPTAGVRSAAVPGDPVELYWVSGYEERTLPARIRAVEHGPEPVWQLEPSGAADRSHRRQAVRGRVDLPVVLRHDGVVLEGTTVDLSESGTRLLLRGHGLPPAPGDDVELRLHLGRSVLDLHGVVVWHNVGGAQWLVALQFADVTDAQAEQLRRRVLRALREERAFIGG